jgi:transglutaminase-like putative cysteine protease
MLSPHAISQLWMLHDAMIYRVRHTTTYAYASSVSLSHNAICLRPRDSMVQTCSAYELLVYPEPAVLNHTVDCFGNQVTFFVLQEPHTALTMTANSTVEVTAPDLPHLATLLPWEEVRDHLRCDRSEASLEAYQFVFDSRHIATRPDLLSYAASSFPPGRPLLEAVHDLTRRIHTDFTYDPKATSVSTPVNDVLRDRHGVCQDFAHLQIGCLRALGLAARYVSGYLLTQPPPGQEPLVGAQASHAWVSVYCPGYGWIDVDPTNNVFPTDGHITVAFGRDYSDVSPIKGVFLGGGEHTLQVDVDVVLVPYLT